MRSMAEARIRVGLPGRWVHLSRWPDCFLAWAETWYASRRGRAVDSRLAEEDPTDPSMNAVAPTNMVAWPRAGAVSEYGRVPPGHNPISDVRRDSAGSHVLPLNRTLVLWPEDPAQCPDLKVWSAGTGGIIRLPQDRSAAASLIVGRSDPCNHPHLLPETVVAAHCRPRKATPMTGSFPPTRQSGVTRFQWPRCSRARCPDRKQRRLVFVICCANTRPQRRACARDRQRHRPA